jgi:hypothetical protein
MWYLAFRMFTLLRVLSSCILCIAVWLSPVVASEKDTSKQINHTSNSKDNVLRQSHLLLLNEADLAQAKLSLSQHAQHQAAVSIIYQWADRILFMQALSVTQNTVVPASGDPHDYFSVGPYWWPDPKQKNGLPWINRDGQVNPTFRDSDSDTKLFQQLLNSVRILSLAYYFSDKQDYATKAISLMQVWFIDAKTKMNPHLNFAQSIPGRTHGRGIGIIDWRGLPYLLDSLTLIQSQQSVEFQQAMDEWLTIFLGWMIESKNGQEEAAMHNNHGTYYDVIVTSIALYLDLDEVARAVIPQTQQRIINQIAENGAQLHELKRTKPFHYSAFNLLAMSQMATLAEKINVNLWQYPSAQQARIFQAFQFMFDNVNNQDLWPGSQEKYINIKDLVGISLLLNRHFTLKDYLSKLLTLDSDIALQAQQCGLLFNHSFAFETRSNSSSELCLY